MAADIVNFTDSTLVDDEVDCPAVIFNIEPVADVKALAIYRKRLVV